MLLFANYKDANLKNIPSTSTTDQGSHPLPFLKLGETERGCLFLNTSPVWISGRGVEEIEALGMKNVKG